MVVSVRPRRTIGNTLVRLVHPEILAGVTELWPVAGTPTLTLWVALRRNIPHRPWSLLCPVENQRQFLENSLSVRRVDVDYKHPLPARVLPPAVDRHERPLVEGIAVVVASAVREEN